MLYFVLTLGYSKPNKTPTKLPIHRLESIQEFIKRLYTSLGLLPCRPSKNNVAAKRGFVTTGSLKTSANPQVLASRNPSRASRETTCNGNSINCGFNPHVGLFGFPTLRILRSHHAHGPISIPIPIPIFGNQGLLSSQCFPIRHSICSNLCRRTLPVERLSIQKYLWSSNTVHPLLSQSI